MLFQKGIIWAIALSGILACFLAARYCFKGYKWNVLPDGFVVVSILVTCLLSSLGTQNLTRE